MAHSFTRGRPNSPGRTAREPAGSGVSLKDLNQQVHDYLLQLDQLRQDSERIGDFIKAQECINRMRDCNLRYAKRIEEESRKTNSETRGELAERHRLELLNFSRMWEDKLNEFERQAEAVLGEVMERHRMDYADQEGILKVQLMNKRPRFSRDVIQLRALMERCVTQRKYLEAEDLRKKLIALEQREIDEFDDNLAHTFEKRTRAMKQQYTNERKAVEQKIKLGREELLSQRKIDFERLLRRHENAFRELDQETKLSIAKTHKYVERQVKALVRDPIKTGMDLRGVVVGERRLNNTSRARTPTRTGGGGGATPRGGGPRSMSRPQSATPSSARSRLHQF
jgi:arsenate reductase-like glutaredoxin family protein